MADPLPPGDPTQFREIEKKRPFRPSPVQVQWLLVVGFLSVGYALYLRYFAIEFSPTALACDGGLPTMLCKTRTMITYLFKNDVFGLAALVIAVLHVIRPSMVTLTAGIVAAGFGIVLYNIGLSGVAIALMILGVRATRASDSVNASTA